MRSELKDKFKTLSKKKQRELIKDYAHSIAKGLEDGLMSDWTYIMSVAIDCSGLENAIEELV